MKREELEDQVNQLNPNSLYSYKEKEVIELVSDCVKHKGMPMAIEVFLESFPHLENCPIRSEFIRDFSKDFVQMYMIDQCICIIGQFAIKHFCQKLLLDK